MSRVLVLGVGPLLEGGVRHLSAHCLRTWHLVQPLVAAGHEVHLFTLPIATDEPELQIESGLVDKVYLGLPYQAFLNWDARFNLERLREACERFKPDCLVGINSYPCAMLPQLAWRAPLWADLNGSVVIEAQVKSAVYGHNSLLQHYWEMEQAPLQRADRFSTVSMRQYYALHGELAAVGRLNRHTFSYSFASHIPNAFNPTLVDLSDVDISLMPIRGGLVPDTAFILLWSGGYNSWTDVDLLADALDEAMAACPELHYVSTGGAIHGYDDLTYARFEQRVKQSKFAKRFHLLGWIESEKVPAVWLQSDLGLCVDSRNHETMFGARNRTINMMAAGLPVLTTLGAEISDELVNAECALGCEPDDREDLARAIVRACRGRAYLDELAEKGERYVLEKFTYAATTKDLVEWVANPSYAPDNQFKLELHPTAANPFAIPANPIEERWHGHLADAHGREARATPSAPAKRLFEAMIGEQRYAKLRFFRQKWWREFWPEYRRHRKQLRRDKDSRHELRIYLTNASNARCQHCFYASQFGQTAGELSLEDYRDLVATLPPVRRIVLTGGEPMLHPESRAIIALLASEVGPERITIHTNGLLPAELHATCAGLLEEGVFSSATRLEVVVSLDGLKSTHNMVREQPRAWLHANHALQLLGELRGKYPDSFELAVNTVIHDKNYTELEALNDHVRASCGCRHDFEFIQGADIGVWNLPEEISNNFNPPDRRFPPSEKWDEILAALTRINRRAGHPNQPLHAAAVLTIRMMKSGKRAMKSIAAGNGNALLYSNGDVALCAYSLPVGNLRDNGMDFRKVWRSTEANRRRDQLSKSYSTQTPNLKGGIQHTFKGLRFMLRKL